MINKFKKKGLGFLFITSMLLFGTNCTNQNNNAVNEKLIKDYYNAYVKKDSALITSILADEFTFGSPVDVPNIDRNTYLRKCWPNCHNTKTFEIEKMIVDGDNAFVTYNGYTNDGKLFRNTEYFKFKDGKIIENVCYFGPGVNYPDNAPK